jgi:hypothetical protein
VRHAPSYRFATAFGEPELPQVNVESAWGEPPVVHEVSENEFEVK